MVEGTCDLFDNNVLQLAEIFLWPTIKAYLKDVL